ncbi:MAG: TonB-dependent receptor, partial [Pseudomonadota bacterium]|nr:TonB-dependent receptor [Pseudomonadota bacterium]
MAAAVLAGLLLPLTALAQEQAPASEAPAEDQARSLDTVTVTGSRISRAGFDTLEPAQVIERESIDNLGITNAAEALFRQPAFNAGASYRGQQGSYGVGVNFIGRFGLGSQRELTLINGRRMISSNPATNFGPASPGQQVDLNVVPASLIQRVETIGVGGAPTYGSDAISGVTNIILRKDFEGVEVNMGVGATEKGDNIRFNLSSTFGKNFADSRGNYTVTVAHDRNNGVLGTAREHYRQSWAFQTNPNAAAMAAFQPGRSAATDGRYLTGVPFDGGPNDGVPGTVLVRDATLPQMSWGGVLFPVAAFDSINRLPLGRKNAAMELLGFGSSQNQYLRFDNTGRLTAHDPGVPFGVRASGGDGIRLSDTNQLISDLYRNNLFVTSNFDLNDNVRLFGELSVYRATSRELLDQAVYNTLDFQGTQSGALRLSVDNPFLHPDDRATLLGLGAQEFVLSRSSRDLASNTASSRSDVKRVVLGANGWFDLGQRAVDWEVSVNHGRADFDYDLAQLNHQRFLNAVNVTRDASGAIVCDSTVAGTVADAACVPLNLFGENNMSDAARAYVMQPTRTRSANRQTIFNANATIGLFDLPGGEVKSNVGYEHRRESADFNPSAFERQGLGRSAPTPGINGSYHTNELFAELLAPVFGPGGNHPGVHRLDVTLKARHVDNSLAGKFNAWTYGLQYEPVEGLQLRGNKTRSFRAPSIVELFQPVTTIYPQIPELCTPGSIGGGNNPTVRRQNCASFFDGFPGVDPATFTGLDGSRQGSSGGNRNLKNEQADSWSAGVVFQPTFARGLTVAADYYRINLTDAIASLSASQIASACFDNPAFNASDVRNANPYCSMITRNDQGQATFVSTTRVNGPSLDFKGWTGEVRYQLNLADHGWGEGRVNLGFMGY